MSLPRRRRRLPRRAKPLAILRAAVAEFFRSIENHPKGRLLGRFLRDAYGFGYALGMDFIGPGRRRMLWVEDLREIECTGRTSDGARIRGYHCPGHS